MKFKEYLKEKQKRGQIKKHVMLCPQCGKPNTSSKYYICRSCLDANAKKLKKLKK